ncbi:MAG: glycosyltransferase, partial [Deltaproteobacteria bacterium]|nr:glycosyltransferase [Deltaproteobacteria bacterium]
RFLPFQPRERLSEVQATSDVSLVTLAPGRGKTSVPSKVLGYMAAARPVIAAVDEGCDTADLIRTSGCGLAVPPGQGDDLAEAILQFYGNPKERLMRGEAGHRHFLQHFERRTVLKHYIDTIQNMLEPS